MAITVQTDTEPTRQRVRRALRVLIADDERDTVLTLTELLREEGHETHGVYDGNDVMPALREFDPDVVLLDISMPGMIGWDVARKIRLVCGQQRPLLIAISGVYKEAADQILGKLAGFNYYLAKPYDPSVLMTLLRDAQ
jgi:DNA-binding response OmpR family regulator